LGTLDSLIFYAPVAEASAKVTLIGTAIRGEYLAKEGDPISPPTLPAHCLPALREEFRRTAGGHMELIDRGL